MTRGFPWVFARGGLGLVALIAVALPSTARAADDEPWDPGQHTTSSVVGEATPREREFDHDGVYGRFDGDLFLALGAGAELGQGARAGGLARALFFHTAGLYFGYARALSGEPALERVLLAGAEIRPLFLPRFALDLEGSGPFLDLTLDSLSLGAGVCFASERADHNSALELSLGFGVPLAAKARGPWLEARAALRPTLEASTGQLFLLLSWYEPVETPLVR
jgi:hypothetical protein